MVSFYGEIQFFNIYIYILFCIIRLECHCNLYGERDEYYMKFYLRNATAEDAEQKGFVYYTSWKETYTGLMPQEYLDNLKLENV